MCSKTTCRRCKKATWKGCGKHVEQALASVPKDQRCACTSEAMSGSKGRGLLSRFRTR